MIDARLHRHRREKWLRVVAVLAACTCSLARPLAAQSVLSTTPNLRAEWPLERWQTAFVFAHRFEFIRGGDELINMPLLTLGIGLPAGFATGLDFTSNSEIVPAKVGGNETQFWIGGPLLRGGASRIDGTAAYNSAARSLDGALTARVRVRSVAFMLEGRGFSDALGTGSSGAALAAGTVLHLTRYLAVSGDLGRMLRPDTLSSVWSTGVALAIPGTRHTFSLHAANVGATTLQGASRPRLAGRRAVRYGFVFTAPLGSRAQWARIFRREPAAEAPADAAVVRVEMRMLAFTPREIRVRAGTTVEWVNRDPLDHTVTADDRS